MARLELSDYLSFGANPEDIEEVEWKVYAYDSNNGPDFKGELLYQAVERDDKRFKTIATLVKQDGTLYNPNLGSIATCRIKIKGLYQSLIEKQCGLPNQHPNQH